MTRKLNINDVDEVVKIHQDAFKDFFLTDLGSRFLKVYYISCVQNEETTIAIGQYGPDNKLLGFSIGSSKAKGYYKIILKSNFLKFSMIGLHLIFKRPMAIIRLIKNMEKQGRETDDRLYCEILSIGIRSDQKGKGHGKILLKGFEKEAAKRDLKKISLTTDYYNNEGVIDFYKNSGYKIMYEFTVFPKRKMYRFIKTAS